MAAELVSDTEEQQAAVTALFNGHTRATLLRAVAATGTITGGAQVAGINPWTVHHWAAQDAEFAKEIAAAKRMAGESVLTRVVGAAIRATDEQLILHPTIAALGINALLPEMRPNASAVNVHIDNRQVTVSDFRAARAMRRQIAAEGLGVTETVTDGQD